jgi:hypothetical protein
MDAVYNILVYKHNQSEAGNDASKIEPLKTWRPETLTERENIRGGAE